MNKSKPKPRWGGIYDSATLGWRSCDASDPGEKQP